MDCIAAIATPSGAGALGIVRLSGSRSFEITSSFFNSSPSLIEAPAWQVVFGKILDSPDAPPVDWAVAVKYAAPKSYTGENSVEIISHGSPLILKKILSLALAAGAREALPGEFTQRAFLNGKMDLAQAEAVAGLIRAGSERAGRLQARVVSGELSRRIKAAAAELVEALAAIDVLIDHPDDAGLMESVNAQFPQAAASKLISLTEGFLSQFEQTYKWREGFSVVLAGRPNAGKSTLLNALLAKDRAIVSPVPGTTRDTIEELIELGGFLVRLVDTAGLRESGDSIELLGLERTKEALGNADIIIWVRDGTKTESADPALEKSLRAFGRPVITVWNKKDLPDFFLGSIPPEEGGLLISAHQGDGLSDLRERLLTLLGVGGGDQGEAVVTEQRHAEHLRRAQEHLTQGQNHLQRQEWELAALEMKQALAEFYAITGQGQISEAILTSIFSKFCVGK